MRASITLDPELVSEAQRLSGITGRSALLRAALVALIERESARRLAGLGGSGPQLSAPTRRRPPAA